MSSSHEFLEPSGLRVTLDRVVFNARFSTGSDPPFCFVYFITIHNGTDLSFTLKARKWVVTNDRGELTVVEGDGVVGQFPEIKPGEAFSYNSFHLLDTKNAVAEGSYLGIDALGRKVLTRIPRFRMVVPEARC